MEIIMKKKLLAILAIISVVTLAGVCVYADEGVTFKGADFGSDVIEAGNVTPSISVTSDTEITGVIMVVAVYKNSKLLDITFETGKTLPQGDSTVTASSAVTVPEDFMGCAVAAMLWDSNYRPLISKQTLNEKSRKADFTFIANGVYCDINTRTKTVYIPISGNTATLTTAPTVTGLEGATVTSNNQTPGEVSDGDIYTVKPANATAPASVYTVKIERALNYKWISDFENGYNETTGIPNVSDTDNSKNRFEISNINTDNGEIKDTTVQYIGLTKDRENTVWDFNKIADNYGNIYKNVRYDSGLTYVRREETFDFKMVSIEKNTTLMRLTSNARQFDMLLGSGYKKTGKPFYLEIEGLGENAREFCALDTWYTVRIVERPAEPGVNYQVYIGEKGGSLKYIGEKTNSGDVLNKANNMYSLVVEALKAGQFRIFFDNLTHGNLY